MSKVGWIKKELEETESEVNVLCNRYFINCEHHWTEDREFILELKGLVSMEKQLESKKMNATKINDNQ